MNRTQITGLLRQVLTLLGTFLFVGFEGWASVSGLVVALAGVGLSVFFNEGKEKIFTLARHALSSVPALGVEFGWWSLEQSTIITGLITSSLAMIWSLVSKDAPLPPAGGTAALLALSCLLFLPSCAAIQSRVTGQEIRYEQLVPVERPDSRPVNVARSDVFRAQTDPDPSKGFGLYDVGRVERALNTVVNSGK